MNKQHLNYASRLLIWLNIPNCFILQIKQIQQQFLKFIQILFMNNRLNKIVMLKQKMLNMKQQLNQLSTQTEPIQQQPNKSTSKPPKHISPAKKYQSNAINRCSTTAQLKQRQFSREEERNAANRSASKRKQEITSKLVTISETVNKQYYKHKQTRNSIDKPIVNEIARRVDSKYYSSVSNLNQSTDSKQNCKQYQTQTNRNTCCQDYESYTRPQKIKTYNVKRSNPILNPQPERNSRKKLVKQSPSPSRMLTEHPKSNQKLHFLGNQCLIVQRKGAVNKLKNRSSFTFQNKSQQPLIPQVRQSSKKHFTHYFMQSNISLV